MDTPAAVAASWGNTVAQLDADHYLLTGQEKVQP